jgi:hypothetical protein
MADTETRDNQRIDEESGRTQLEQRFRDIGARALIEESARLSESIISISKKLADVERSTDAILTLLDFPLPQQGAWQRPLMKRVVVTAKMLCNPADGFHKLEFSSDGTAFRWTGPQPEFRFMVYVDRKEACPAELIIINADLMDSVAEIACYVDRSWVPCRPLAADAGDFLRFGFTLPKLEINRGTEILFVAPSIFLPRDIDPKNSDPRTLGVQFVELRIGDSGGVQDGVSGVEQSHD